MTARTFHGLEELLAEELRSLSAQNIQISKRAVTFEGDLALLYKANIGLRTALKILVPIHECTATTPEQLYEEVRKVDWTKYLGVNGTFMVETAVQSSLFTHSKYVGLKAKDAIVDQFREKFGSRPSVNLQRPNLYVDVRISSDQVCISLNSSGDALYKRGYRLDTNEAPLSEVLAAGMVMLTGWKGEKDLLDFMCGSGTIVIEAAMIASDMAPNLLREDFAFKTWNDFDPRLLMDVRKEFRAKIKEPTCKIFGSDIDKESIRMAMDNATRAKVDDRIMLKVRDYTQMEPPFQNGIIISNPPYQLRLRTDDIEAFYKEIGDVLKKKYNGFDAWIISANLLAIKQVGLKTSRKIMLYNGPLECRFNKYELYEGSRKLSHEANNALRG